MKVIFGGRTSITILFSARLLYKNITISGLKRKFCPLCRYTFKDNWAIESHYFSSSCHYTCRYCGIRFNKQRYQFDEHLKHHEEKGDEPSDKVFAPRKWNGAYPKVGNWTLEVSLWGQFFLLRCAMEKVCIVIFTVLKSSVFFLNKRDVKNNAFTTCCC